jgi:hypothetical protein
VLSKFIRFIGGGKGEGDGMVNMIDGMFENITVKCSKNIKRG